MAIEFAVAFDSRNPANNDPVSSVVSEVQPGDTIHIIGKPAPDANISSDGIHGTLGGLSGWTAGFSDGLDFVGTPPPSATRGSHIGHMLTPPNAPPTYSRGDTLINVAMVPGKIGWQIFSDVKTYYQVFTADVA